jgi:Domain of unknown function (DUF3598)
MGDMSKDTMTEKLQNWNNFCQYHANNDWYGTWNTYSPDGQLVEYLQCIRSFHLSEDDSEIYHQNHYTYADGKKETKTFGPYKKPNSKSLFLDNSFSWGSTNIETGSNFGFETGFRYEDRRISVVVVYDGTGKMEKIVAISEHLASYSEESKLRSAKDISENWQGTGKTMTPDWVVSPPVTASWNQLENLVEDYLTLHFIDGISICCPRKIEAEKEFCLAADWLVNPNLLQRGIRQFDTSGFTGLTLEILVPC